MRRCRPNPANGLPFNPALEAGVAPAKKRHNVGLIVGVTVGVLAAGALLLMLLVGVQSAVYYFCT